MSDPYTRAVADIESCRHLVSRLFTHRKTGHLYQVLELAIQEATMTAVVVYGDASRIHWTRPLAEFLDGRFEPYDGPPKFYPKIKGREPQDPKATARPRREME